MTNDAIVRMTLIEVRDAIAAGELSSEEAVGAAIEQAERFREEYALFVTFTPEQALAQARAADKARAEGKPLGPLHGVPITIKDNIDVAGLRTTAGSRVLADRVPAEDATVVKKLRSAGAISLGQTNMHEMALGGSSTNPHYGAVRNPWDPERVPGGSSGGAAACAALRIGHAAGSVRLPASICGLVGLKQTHGLASLAGVVPTGNWTTDHIGPLARTVADVGLMLSLMQGHDPADPDSASRVPEPYGPLASLEGITVGVSETYFWQGLDPEVEKICRNAVTLLGGAGARIVTLELEQIELAATLRPLTACESYVFHEPYLHEHEELYGKDIRYRLLAARYILASDYVRALRVRRLITEELSRALDGVDVLVMPTMAVKPSLIDLASTSLEGQAPDAPDGTAVGVRNTMPFNQSGLPAISVPTGLTSDGLPVGLQLAAAAFADQKLLAIASVAERLFEFDSIPPILRTMQMLA